MSEKRNRMTLDEARSLWSQCDILAKQLAATPQRYAPEWAEAYRKRAVSLAGIMGRLTEGRVTAGGLDNGQPQGAE